MGIILIHLYDIKKKFIVNLHYKKKKKRKTSSKSEKSEITKGIF